ncbi:MAG: amidohydrolase [Acidimicrobiia bacterium]
MTYHDHHFHPLGYAALRAGLDLMNVTSLHELMKQVAEQVDTVEGPIVAHRLNDENLNEGRLPTAAELDQVTGERPALLHRYCGHIAVANTAALRLAGIHSATPDPPGGSFDRTLDGTPTGVLRETAVAAVSATLASLIPSPRDQAIREAFSGLRSMGIRSITGIVSAGEPLWCGVTDELPTLIRLGPELPVTMDILVITGDPAKLASAKEALDQAEGPLRFKGWKGFADGSFGGHTAALHQPYADRPETRGMLRLDPARDLKMAETALELGGDVAVHAIGDRAADQVLDLFTVLIERGAPPHRLRMEHASLLTDEAIERMGRLGVVASVQPAFIPSEVTWLERRLGPGRMGMVYRFRSLLAAGVEVIGGSDAPVELPDPETGITAAVGRHGINPAEAITRAEAEALFRPPSA